MWLEKLRGWKKFVYRTNGSIVEGNAEVGMMGGDLVRKKIEISFDNCFVSIKT